MTRAGWLLGLALLLVAPAVQAQPVSSRYDAAIRAAARQWWPPSLDWVWWRAQLWQESRFRPEAVSPVGAAGIAQFMPGTWRDVARQLQLPPGTSPTQDIAISAGAYYMAQLMRAWTTERPEVRRLELAQASYNAGTGNIARAQRVCGGARDWPDIVPCLPQVTGRHAAETIGYVRLIAQHRARMLQMGVAP